MSETIGSIQVIASINTKDYDAGKKHIEKGNSDLENGAEKTSKGFSAAWTGAIAGVAAALTNKFLGAITSSIDGAVKRVDTLNNSSRTFENMGFSATSSSEALNALKDSILGLPTPLDSAVRGMTSLAATYGDINKGQKIFTALNNAILGFGGSAFEVDNAIQQLSQLPMDGPLDAQTWNSLRNSGLTPVLVAIGKDMGLSVNELKTRLGEGTLTVQDFTNELIKLDQQGGGGLKSLQQIAKDSTSGIGTGFANMQTAIVRGVASIIDTIGSQNISNAISKLGDVFSSVLKDVSSFIKYVKENATLFSTLAVSVGTAGASIVLYTGYVKVATAFTAAYTAVSSYLTLVNSLQAQGLGTLRAAWLALNIVMRANPLGIIITLITAVVGGLIFFFNQTKEGKKIWADFVKFLGDSWNNIINFVNEAAKNIQNVWNSVVKFFTEATNNAKNVIVSVFNAVIGFFKEWGPEILAVIFFPFSLALGAIIANWSSISAFFQSVWNGIVKVFTPVVNFFSSTFTIASNIIKTIFDGITEYLKSVWNGWVIIFTAVIGFFNMVFTAAYSIIVKVFTPIVNFFAGVFGAAWEAIKSVFSTVSSFFSGVWNTIVGLFTNVGTSVGNAVGGAFKSVVNSILRFAVGFINDFIRMLNGAIDIINNIPGVDIGKIGTLPVPQLATGGITTGPTLAMIGEGREQEAVLPLSKLDAMLNNDGGAKVEYNINQITISSEVDGERWLRRLTNDQEIVSNGLVPQQKYMGAN